VNVLYSKEVKKLKEETEQESLSTVKGVPVSSLVITKTAGFSSSWF
jgi:hypothetical protein